MKLTKEKIAKIEENLRILEELKRIEVEMLAKMYSGEEYEQHLAEYMDHYMTLRLQFEFGEF